MCGIIGYIGKKQVVPILLEGLQKLEYRGYDSAGITLKNEEEMQVIKSVGKIEKLVEKVAHYSCIDSSMGIAHTRWATHGVPSEGNAHPHTVGKITIVHNGIIENAVELREKLERENVSFQSETDTEVIAAIMDSFYDGDMMEAIEKTLEKIQGSYALGILVEDQNRIYAVRKDSPLVVGVSEDGFYITSDISAIGNYTNRYVLLEDNEVAVLNYTDFIVVNKGCKVDKTILTADISKCDPGKNHYEHYMLKEIMEEPEVLKKTLESLVSDFFSLPNLKQYEEIHIVACGSAMYAGMIGKILLEEMASIKIFCEVASEYRYKKVIYDRRTLVVLISQSGETADTIAAMRKATKEGIPTLAIVNVVESTIARESSEQIFIQAGPEIAVATTKAYLLQVATLALLSYKATLKNESYEEESILNEIRKIPIFVQEILNQREDFKKIALEIYQHDTVFFIGRKVDYAISLEGSLKLKEVSYIHSEAYQAGELKHGTISLIEEGMPVISIITEEDIREKTISNMEEVKSRGAKIILLNNEKMEGYEFQISVPKVSSFFQPILVVPCLQLIAYEVAKLRGCDIDQPKNLAKSVTVE